MVEMNDQLAQMIETLHKQSVPKVQASKSYEPSTYSSQSTNVQEIECQWCGNKGYQVRKYLVKWFPKEELKCDSMPIVELDLALLFALKSMLKQKLEMINLVKIVMIVIVNFVNKKKFIMRIISQNP